MIVIIIQLTSDNSNLLGKSNELCGVNGYNTKVLWPLSFGGVKKIKVAFMLLLILH